MMGWSPEITMIDIIQVDQWTSSGDIEQQNFDAVTLHDVTGGDSEAAKAIFGGTMERKTVEEDDKPSIGNVWYVKGANGKCKLWKYNYDTSD
jgi:hypothetical protein